MWTAVVGGSIKRSGDEGERGEAATGDARLMRSQRATEREFSARRGSRLQDQGACWAMMAMLQDIARYWGARL